MIAHQKTFLHGIHPPENKFTADASIRRFPFAPLLMLPLSQHIGAPSKCIVRVGQEVHRGEKIADAGGFVSVPMHAPASGAVKKITNTPMASGVMVPTIFIEPHPASGQEPYPFNPPVNGTSEAKQVVTAIQNAGLVGMGGAAFPSHVKFSIPEGKFIDTLIINGVECEPYLTTDYRVMLEDMRHLFTGIKMILKATGAERAIIGIEANKPDAIEALKKGIPAGNNISVEKVEVKYPQGAEKMLVYSLIRRKVPSGGLPLDVHVVVSNVATTTEIGKLLPGGMGLIERVITVSGDGIRKPGNYRIPIGTPLKFILQHVGMRENSKKIILGGPMMGRATARLDVPVTKGTSGIVVLTEENLPKKNGKTYPCIKCGKCVDACPMFLNPSRLGILAKAREYDMMMNDYHLLDCFECGSCSYVCPSNIPLVQLFQLSKGILREQKASK